MNSHDIRIWGIQQYDGKKSRTFAVRWVVNGRRFRATFATKALAESRRAELVMAQRRGEAFDDESGLPEAEARQKVADVTWYEHAVAFAEMKWPALEPGSRRSLAASLATITLALVTDRHAMPTDYDTAFTALVNWSFNQHARTASEPPKEFGPSIDWVCSHSVKVIDLRNPRVARIAYDATMISPSGKQYAVNTYQNKMKGLAGAIKYAIELDLLDRNPLDRISTARPRKTSTVDRRVVVNPEQARKLIAAVGRQGWTGERYVAFFATMYFAALRPAEVLALRIQDCKLPKRGWGELCFAESTPYVGTAWSNDGDDSPRKALKHRAKHESRTVPVHPELVAHLRAHIEEFGTADDGRIFVRENGQDVRYGTFANIWSKARKEVLTETQINSPLGKRPYDLRHAAVSTWLNAGVSAPQVAEWAGHSVEMLLSTYAKCIDGQQDRDRKRIEDALAGPTTKSAKDDDPPLWHRKPDGSIEFDHPPNTVARRIPPEELDAA